MCKCLINRKLFKYDTCVDVILRFTIEAFTTNIIHFTVQKKCMNVLERMDTSFEK